MFSTFWTEVREPPAAARRLSAEGETAELPSVSPAQPFPSPPRPGRKRKAPPPLASGRGPEAPRQRSGWADRRFGRALSQSPSHTRLGLGTKAPAHVAATGELRRSEEHPAWFLPPRLLSEWGSARGPSRFKGLVSPLPFHRSTPL